QGDPMSPYLFVLGMDKLSHIISDEIDSGKWKRKPMKAGRNGPSISHIMFADDILLFGQATSESMGSVIKALQLFCSMSGQQVNHDKSSIFFSKNVSMETRVHLVEASGFTEVSNIGKYLGVPALGRSPRRNDFQYLVEKVKAKLAGWKAQQLSLAGRITLAKSVIQAIPIYPMLSMRIPKVCLNEIHKIRRSFIWGDNDERRHAHLIGWQTMTLPKSQGGMGFKDLHIMNDACLLKMNWALLKGEHHLWGQVLLGKYGRGRNARDGVIAHQTDSVLWKAIVNLWPQLQQHVYWAVGDGQKINVWKDKWLDDKSRICDLIGSVPEDVQSWKLLDIINDQGEWNFNKLHQYVPNNTMQKIKAIVPPHANNGCDEMLWPGINMGHFTWKEYVFLCG
ncbi:ribonuclease H, partial [Trifolium medium]|nr:ribonuclease H [Trifolium medium]